MKRKGKTTSNYVHPATENMMETIDQREVSIVKQQATKALTAATALIIKTDEDMVSATDMLSKIKQVGKMIKDRKEQITRPLTEALNSARDLFKPIELSHYNAEVMIKSKMLAYQDDQDKKREVEKMKLAERVEKGTLKPETAIKRMEDIQEVQTNVKGKFGEVTTRTIKKVRIVDESKLPREYLVPNMPKINEDSLKQGVQIPGVEIFEERVIAAR